MTVALVGNRIPGSAIVAHLLELGLGRGFFGDRILVFRFVLELADGVFAGGLQALGGVIDALECIDVILIFLIVVGEFFGGVGELGINVFEAGLIRGNIRPVLRDRGTGLRGLLWCLLLLLLAAVIAAAFTASAATTAPFTAATPAAALRKSIADREQ